MSADSPTARTGRGRIRAATPADLPALHELVHALAGYERNPGAVVATIEDFRSALFGAQPLVHALVAEVDGDRPDELSGIALWYVTFSTWMGRHGIWLEDLYVRPERRGLGLGRALLAELAKICVERGYPRLEWNVLNWNEPALGFYRQLGAEPLDDWVVHRISGEPLDLLAGGEDVTFRKPAER